MRLFREFARSTVPCADRACKPNARSSSAPTVGSIRSNYLPLTREGTILPLNGEGNTSMSKIDLLQGTLDMLILRVLSRGEMHGWGIVDRLGQLSKNTLKLGEGSVYPSLYRVETKGWIKATWAQTDNNRRAKYYLLTRAGRKQLEAEQQSWGRLSAIIAEVMQKA